MLPITDIDGTAALVDIEWGAGQVPIDTTVDVRSVMPETGLHIGDVVTVDARPRVAGELAVAGVA